jgi:thioredoxin 1
MMKLFLSIVACFVACGMAPPLIDAAAPATGGPLAVPVPGMVTMVDIGADRCIPCKMMAPIIEELKREYAGRASIVFIDIWKNPDQGKHFRIRVIPTQIFYKADGTEAGRHEGLLDKPAIVAMLKKLGVP